ncbi:MAG: Glycosyl transferase, family 2 [Candidatus Jorgensenbacteria bacterium GW2011_GWA2_45_13]|uniref:Glycosyl transferase, family 2 n=1 Tax=Candidatus Jorgensenbacteria bacterium GW2011_GWA2_45_13 TaxID=1618662 RepID=A0A0G1L2P8_9BACT|nr:MAG: Glycosyl transferase, family 2 [Candidatus Jorgensenbacteria bacterium GW2011_GWA2_45_13]
MAKNTNDELTIVIPAKNEAKYIGTLLESLKKQDYPLIGTTKIFIADAGSTDGTQDVIKSFAGDLMVEIISGGFPSKARNNGAKKAKSKYILFVDADMEMRNPTLLRNALSLIKRKHYHLVTTLIKCNETGGFADQFLYFLNNVAEVGSKFFSPMATGMIMLFEKQWFDKLGGFNEKINYAEDYYLSKQTEPRRFGVLLKYILATNRRFQKTGHWRILQLFLDTMLHSRRPEWFFKDKHYWD